MKRTSWVKYLPVFLASTCLGFIALPQAYLAQPVLTAQVRLDYDSYMKSGYAATLRADHTAALINFRRALSARPGDRYATDAISNVSRYVYQSQERSKISFISPNRGAPRDMRGGATRGSCKRGNKPLTALIPATDIEWTMTEYPLLLFYLPQTQAQTLELALLDENENEVGKTTIAPSPTPGIVSLSFSALKNSEGKSLPPLKIGKNYHWYLSIVCDSQDHSADIFVDGRVRRVEVDPVLASKLNAARGRDRVFLYAVNGIWYDTLAALYAARQSSPNDSLLVDDWADLLKSVKLDEIAREPLL